jgi:hypothetical protein
MRHHVPNVLQLNAGGADQCVLDPANSLADDMQIMLNQQIHAEENGTGKRILNRHNPISSGPAQYGFKDLLQAGTRKQLSGWP